jgi:hypothetical protein
MRDASSGSGSTSDSGSGIDGAGTVSTAAYETSLPEASCMIRGVAVPVAIVGNVSASRSR